MTIRNVTKNLVGMEDLLTGVGKEDQVRNEVTYSMGRMDIPYAVNSTAELQALDVTRFINARVYSSTTAWVDYRYDAVDVTGIAPITGSGSWLVTDLRTDLIAANGTSLITHTQGGTDYNLATYLQNRYVVNAKDYGAVLDGVTDDTTAMQTAGATGDAVFISELTLNITAPVSGTFFSLGEVVVSGGGAITINNILVTSGSEIVTPLVNPNGPRSIIQYGNATTIKIRDRQYPMGGFRFHGQYKKTNVPVFQSEYTESNVSTSSALAFGMSSVVLENWYGVFACANDGDAYVTFRLVPFLRVESVATDVVTLRKAGIGVHSSAPQTYTWANDALNGVECLVITETIEGRTIAFSGRETTITDSTTTTVTLANIGTVAAEDWLLPAPTDEFSNYRYCGACYVDTAEIRNIADSGSIVKSRGTFDVSGTNTGSVPTAEVRQPSGYISPLATAVYFQSTGVLGTATTGQYVENFDIDSGTHTVASGDLTKMSTSPQSFNFGEMYIPFAFGPQYYYSNAGPLVATRTNGQQNIYGWLEP